MRAYPSSTRQALRLRRRSFVAGLTVAAGTTTAAVAQQSGLKFATGGEGGGFVVYGSAFVDAVKWANPKIAVKPLTTRGSLDNVPLLEAGTADIGLVFGEMTQELFNPKDGPPTQLKVITTAYSSPGMFVVRADSRYRTIKDLIGRSVVWNGRGSGLALQGRFVMEGLGLNPEKDFEAIYTETLVEGPVMILEGRAAALWGAGNRWPGFVKIANDARGGRFVTPDGEQITRVVDKYPFMRRISIPAARYPGQPDSLLTVGSWSYVLARPNLDEAAGYDLAA
ncbi:MAG TPA: TAXI family TRAP transporter solute-binding subunit, partial [Reyranella sp.]|nr:TAXI family TRAP transporter solute-binding subunit [Reyranella sp.]